MSGSITDEIKVLKARLDKLEASTPAPESELDGKYGDPVVKFLGKKLKETFGRYEGVNFSQTEPKFLFELAGFLRWKAEQDRKKLDSGEADDPTKLEKYVAYSIRDARLAEGWARRLLAKPEPAKTQRKASEHEVQKADGYQPPSVGFPPESDGDDLPF